jgi:hypothetical protein
MFFQVLLLTLFARIAAIESLFDFCAKNKEGRAVIVCRLAPFIAALALKHKQFGYCKGLASLLL